LQERGFLERRCAWALEEEFEELVSYGKLWLLSIDCGTSHLILTDMRDAGSLFLKTAGALKALTDTESTANHRQYVDFFDTANHV
jgi:hypothetical protein